MLLFGQNGFSPLVVATREGHYEIVKALLEHREKPDLTTVSDTVCTSIPPQYFVITSLFLSLLHGSRDKTGRY